MITNKEYERLTPKNAVVTGRFSGKTLLDRLYELENAIENGTLVFLPCKVGDEFWWILNKYSGEYEIVEEKVKQIRICDYGFYIIDCDGSGWYLNEIYFTKEAAEAQLKEIREKK